MASTFICTDEPVSGNSGNSVFNLGLSEITGSAFINNSKTISFSGKTNNPMVNYTDATLTNCHTTWTQTSKIVTFQVTKAGSYNISAITNGNAANAFSIFTSSVFNCTNFVGSNAYTPQPNYINWSGSKSVTLNACTTYYALVYDYDDYQNFILNISGSGDVIEVQTSPVGFSYTYVAVNQSNNQIAAVSTSSDFRSISGGSFKVYGLSYANGFNTNDLLNKTIDQVYGIGTCLLFSNNSKPLTIIPSPCPSSLVLTNPTNNITSGNVTRQASAANGKITATNLVTGTGTKATYLAKAIELNAGFTADSGTTFRAETGGCN